MAQAPFAGAALPLFRNAVEQGNVNPEAYDMMWVQGGGLQGGSGNQLELPRRGHRFFGYVFDNYDHPHNITIGEPNIWAGGILWNGRPLTWHGNSRMERMNLPNATQCGMDYSDAAFMFCRLADASFELSVAPWGSDLARQWQQQATQRHALFSLGIGSDRIVGLI